MSTQIPHTIPNEVGAAILLVLLLAAGSYVLYIIADVIFNIINGFNSIRKDKE